MHKPLASDPFICTNYASPYGAGSASKTCKDKCTVLLWIGLRELALNLLYLSVFLFELHNKPRSWEDRYLKSLFFSWGSSNWDKVMWFARVHAVSQYYSEESCTNPGLTPACFLLRNWTGLKLCLLWNISLILLLSQETIWIRIYGRETKAAYFP